MSRFNHEFSITVPDAVKINFLRSSVKYLNIGVLNLQPLGNTVMEYYEQGEDGKKILRANLAIYLAMRFKGKEPNENDVKLFYDKINFLYEEGCIGYGCVCRPFWIKIDNIEDNQEDEYVVAYFVFPNPSGNWDLHLVKEAIRNIKVLEGQIPKYYNGDPNKPAKEIDYNKQFKAWFKPVREALIEEEKKLGLPSR